MTARTYSQNYMALKVREAKLANPNFENDFFAHVAKNFPKTRVPAELKNFKVSTTPLKKDQKKLNRHVYDVSDVKKIQDAIDAHRYGPSRGVVFSMSKDGVITQKNLAHPEIPVKTLKTPVPEIFQWKLREHKKF